MKERPEFLHNHEFHADSRVAERRTRIVLFFTVATMFIEIAGGLAWNSMALLADGFHMASHAFALGLSAFAYFAARRFSADKAFAFGTWKIEILAGYTSALLLLGVAALMFIGSVERLIEPRSIDYSESITVATLGLLVNVVSIWLLGHFSPGHTHSEHEHHVHSDSCDHHAHGVSASKGHEKLHHHDLNLRAVYIHVLTDLLTSVLAILALVGGSLWGWYWLDPVTGLVGSVLVALWAKGLIVASGKVLLDREMDHPIVRALHDLLEKRDDNWLGVRLLDVHVWRIGRDRFSAALAVETTELSLGVEQIRKRIEELPNVVHVTVEIHRAE